jgi:glycosyltransferase involved in cell wall biosynthesis
MQARVVMIFVFVSYNYSPNFNSPERWLKRTESYNGLLECLSKKNRVISLKQIDYEGNYEYNGVEHHFVKFNKRPKYIHWELNNYVKNLNPDVVFVQGLHEPLQVIHLGMILNKKTKIIAQNHAEKPATGLKKYAQKTADRFVDAYLFASKNMGMDWVEKGNLSSPQKIHEVMEVSSLFYPIERALALTKTGITSSFAFLWVGRLNENKDPLNVIKTFLEFAELYPTARLYMIYHTEELMDEIMSLLNKNSAYKEVVILVGRVPYDDLLYWYNSVDFVVSGSHYEGSGTAICEAMSCGCIPVVTDIFSFRMITDNGNCGILYEPGNQAALLKALKQTQQMNIAEQRDRAIAYFKANLSFEAIAEQVHQIALLKR